MRIWTVLLVAGIALGITATAFSQTTGPASVQFMLTGVLLKVEGNNLIINARQKGGERKEVSVATDERTVFFVDGEPGKLDDLKADMMVSVGPGHNRDGEPPRLGVAADSRGLVGTVVKVDGTNVLVSVPQRGGEPKEVSVATDDATKVIFLGQRIAPDEFEEHRYGKIDDLKAGIRIRVLPATGTAIKIIVSNQTRTRPRE